MLPEKSESGQDGLPIAGPPDVVREVDRYLSRQKEAVTSKPEQNPAAFLQHEICTKIEFCLAQTDEDLLKILDVERQLVIDPYELKREFSHIRALRAQGATTEEINEFIKNNTRFGKAGSHVSNNTIAVMREIRKKGWAIIAGFRNQDTSELHPIGFNYGLHSMPVDTKIGDPFHMLSKDTIRANDRDMENIIPEESAFNWRTGILEEAKTDVLRSAGLDVSTEAEAVSLRRFGIASALKFLITSIAKKNGKKSIYFNIGTIYDTKSKERIRNTPSFSHNLRYFEDDLGYREGSTPISIDDPQGGRETVGEVFWRVRGDELEDALHNLRSDKSVLKSRSWNMEELEKIAQHMYDELNVDGHLPADDSQD